MPDWEFRRATDGSLQDNDYSLLLGLIKTNKQTKRNVTVQLSIYVSLLL